MKAMINWWRPPIKAPEEHKEEVQEASARLAAAKETSIDAAIVTVLSDESGIFTLKLFSQDSMSSLPTGFVESSAKHHGKQWLAMW